MKILFFSRLFYPHIGGVEKHTLEVGNRLVRSGHEVVVITEELSKNELETLSKKGREVLVNIERIPVSNDNFLKKFLIWKWLFKNRKLIKDADIIHCHDVFFWYLPFRFLYPNKKVYTTFHGYEGNHIPTKKAILQHKIAEKLSLGNMCIGDFFRKWYGTKPTIVSYGGIDEHTIINTPELLKKTKSYTAVFVGRLEEETGILIYLKLVNLLKEKGIKIKLIVLGDGSLKNQSEKYSIKNKLDILFLGFVENVNPYITKSDFVFTSRYLGILESLAFGKLVFATFNNAIKEDYLKLTPFEKNIIIEENEFDLAKRFLFLANNVHAAYEIQQKGLQWAKKQTWNALVKQYYRLWGL